MIYEPYAIVVVPFPFTDRATTKRRPAIVLSQEKHQEQTDHITLLMVTSAKHSAWASDHLIEDLDPTGLTSASIVRQKLFTIDQNLIVKKIGNLSSHDQHILRRLLKKHLLV